MEITITRNQHPKAKPPADSLGFGQYFTDHMFVMDYNPEKGWHDGRVVPYAPLSLDPACMVLHYGQELFEGLKAYRGAGGEIRFFRAIENARRLNRSCQRLFVPTIDEQSILDAMTTVVRVDASWVPDAPDTSLYVRPFIIATDPFLGVRSSSMFQFIIILSPVGSYYKGGMVPTNIYVEASDVRAVRGGMGEAKVGANYAATIRAQESAKRQGFTQVLWLDGFEHKYVEEIGTSNAFFVINDVVITPPLEGTILPGITRQSCLTLLAQWGIQTLERPISIDEVAQAASDGRLSEAFASGTAAVISPVGSLHWQKTDIVIGGGAIGMLSRRLYDTITGIQRGRIDDPNGWSTIIE